MVEYVEEPRVTVPLVTKLETFVASIHRATPGIVFTKGGGETGGII